MTIRAMFRRRAIPKERVNDRHASVIARLGNALDGTPAAFDPKRVYFESEDELSGASDLTPAFADTKFLGAISYCPRRAIDADHGMFDDVLTITVPRSRRLYSVFVKDLFIRIVDAFDAYRAGVSVDEDLELSDFDEIVELSERTGKDVDGRDGVFRIGPANAFDEELCMRAFRLRAEEVVRKVQPHVEIARLVKGKACFVVTSNLLERSEVLAIDQKFKLLLTTDAASESSPRALT